MQLEDHDEPTRVGDIVRLGRAVRNTSVIIGLRSRKSAIYYMDHILELHILPIPNLHPLEKAWDPGKHSDGPKTFEPFWAWLLERVWLRQEL